MEAFGKKLTEARVARGLEFDQVSRETNITRRYLEALENEDFTVFPGEPYLLGFLRNYCDYLGLNSNEIITAYKNQKIQEAPVPLKDLMPRRSVADDLFGSPNAPRVIAVIAVVAVIVLLSVGAVSLFGKRGNREPAPAVVESRTAAVYEVGSADFKERLYIGDSLNVTIPAGVYKMTVLDTAPALKLDTPIGARVIELGQDLLVDLTGDDVPDVKVFVADLFKNNPAKGADVHVSTTITAAAGAPGTGPAAETVQAAAADVTVPAAGTAPANSKQTILFEGGSAYPVTLNATFRGYCLFRYESDRTTREERYYQKSELLTVQAKNGIRIWASNGNSVKLQMVAGGKTVDLEVSRPGEVMVRDLKWVKDEETGRFKFMVMDID